MAERQFNVVEHSLTDGSKVYGVKGYDMTGNRLIVIDCDSAETANELADLLDECCFGIEIADGFTERADRLHAATKAKNG